MQSHMVEFAERRYGFAIPRVKRDIDLPIKKQGKLPAVITATTMFLTPPYIHYSETVNQVLKDLTHPVQTERPLQDKVDFIHNDTIGLKPSSYLAGVLDLEYKNTDNNTWELYNNIVPNVIANGIDTSAELAATPVTMEDHIDPKGNTTFTIQYPKLDQIGMVDGLLSVGNGAHFKIVGTIPHDQRSITMEIVPNEDSTVIEKAALSNFYGSKQKIDKLKVQGSAEHDVHSYPPPNDGNFKAGDFYDIYTNPSGKISFWRSEANTFVQHVSFNRATKVETEIRKHEWRPELGTQEEKPWFETVRPWQNLKPDANDPYPNKLTYWEFGYSNDAPFNKRDDDAGK